MSSSADIDSAPNNSIYDNAAEALKEGSVIAYPTEGVWGLGCDPRNRSAVEKVLMLKSRPVSKGLIIVASDIAHFSDYIAALSQQEIEQIRASVGQATTWLIDHKGSAPSWISGEQNTLAIRLSNHPVIVGLCEAFGGAIVSTSANPAGREPALTWAEVEGYFSNLIEVIVRGDRGDQNGASEIRELKTGRVIRSRAHQ